MRPGLVRFLGGTQMKLFQPRYVTLGSRWIEIPVKILVVDDNSHNTMSAFWQFNKVDEVESAGFVAGSISVISAQNFDDALQRFNPFQERIPGADEIHTLVLNRGKIEITQDDTIEIKRLVAGEFDIVLTSIKMYKSDDFDAVKDSFGWPLAVFAAGQKNVKAIGLIADEDDNLAQVMSAKPRTENSPEFSSTVDKSVFKINETPIVVMRSPMIMREFSGGEYRVKDWIKAVRMMEDKLQTELLHRS